MRFVLLDRIAGVEQTGRALVAVKNLSLAEEYLADHFPGFPVMPGVLMLEALTQAGAWLVRDMEDFAHSVVVLKQAKTIKYGSFVEPGRQLQLRVELVSHDDRESELQGGGSDRRPGDGQGTVHADPLQPPRPRPGPARDRRVDRRRPSRPLRHAPQGFGGGPGHGPDQLDRVEVRCLSPQAAGVRGRRLTRVSSAGSLGRDRVGLRDAAMMMLQGFEKYSKIGSGSEDRPD